MSKRIAAFLIAASIGLGSAGCTDSGKPDPGKTVLAVVTAPLWIPLLLTTHGTPTFGSGGGSGRTYTPSVSAIRTWAEKGDAQAQFTLCQMYADGDGVSRNDMEAANWCRRSADQGFGKAQIRIGLFYETGRGVAQDDVAADTWYAIAAASDEHSWVSTALTREEGAKQRDNIEKRMTPEQIAEVRKRAQEWRPVKAAD